MSKFIAEKGCSDKNYGTKKKNMTNYLNQEKTKKSKGHKILKIKQLHSQKNCTRKKIKKSNDEEKKNLM